MVLRAATRERSPADVLRLLLGLLLLGLGLLAATVARNTVGGAEADVVEVYDRIPDRLTEIFTAIVFVLAAAVPVLAIVVLFARRRYRRALALLVGSQLAALAMLLVDGVLTDRGLVDRVRQDTAGELELTDPGFASSPLIASVVAMVVIGSPWLTRSWRRALWTGVAALVVLRMVSSSEPAFDVFLALAVGLVVGSAALVAIGTPTDDPSAPELLGMVGRVGPVARIVQEDHAEPLAYDVTMADGDRLHLSVRTPRDRSADLLARLWRYVRLRTDESDRPFGSVQRRVEHEALAQSLARAGGARVNEVRSVVASPQGSVGLLTEGMPGTSAARLTPDELVSGGGLVDAWRQVARLHRAGIAHRVLGLGQFSITADGKAVVEDFDDARVAASPDDLARDTAQMLVATAVPVGVDAAVDAAVAAMGDEPVVAAMPYLQPLALPGPTRRALRRHKDLLAGMRHRIREVTSAEEVPLARLERIRPRTLVSIVAFAVAFYVLLPQLADVQRTADAASRAELGWLIPAFLASCATYVFAAVAMIGSVPQRVPFWATLRMQVASSFASRIAPANTGALAVGVRFLQRAGTPPTVAATAVGLNTVAGFVVHLLLLAAFVAWTGRSGVGDFSLPDATIVLLVVAIVLAASGILIAVVPPLRRKVVPPLVAQVRTAVGSLADVVTDPWRVLALVGGSVGVTMSYIAALAATIAAFDGGLSLPQIGTAYLLAAAVGSVAPTPGGLGALEAALVSLLTGYGMPDGRAIAAVLTFRLLTFWLPVLPGWVVFQRMQSTDEL